ncbi:MAG: CHAT domain-containing tetratricopeptide repeat protein [Bacteroidota bacterium]
MPRSSNLKYLLPIFLCFFLTKISSQEVPRAENQLKIGDSLFLEENFKQAILSFENALSIFKKENNWEDISKCHNKLAKSYFELRELDKGKEQADLSLLILKSKLKKTSVEEAIANQHLGYYFQRKSELSLSLEYFLKAVEVYKKTVPAYHKDLVQSHLKVAYMMGWTGKYGKALKHLDTVKTLCEKNKGENLRNYAQYYSDVRKIQTILGDKEAAESSLLKEKSLLAQFPERDMILEAKNLIGFSNHYASLAEHQKSVDYSLKALTIYKKEVGENSSWIILLYTNISQNSSQIGEHSNAHRYAKRALEISLKLFGKDHVITGKAYTSLGLAYSYSQDYEKALDYFFLQIENQKKNFGEQHKDLAFRYGNIGQMYTLLNEHEKAIVFFEKATTLGEIVFGKEHPNMASIYRNLGDAYLAIDMNDKALSCLKTSLSLDKKAFGIKNWNIGLDHISLGRYYMERKDYKSSLLQFDKILEMYHEEYSDALEEGNDHFQVTFNVLSLIQEAIVGKGDVYRLQYLENNRIKDLYASKEAYEMANSISKKTRQGINKHSDKIEFAKSSKKFMEGALATHFLLYKNESSIQNFEKVFFYSERSKANILMEILAHNETKELGDYTDIVRKENKLKADKSLYLSKIENEREKNNDSSTQLLNTYNTKLFNTIEKYDSLLLAIKENHPNFFNINNGNTAITVSKVQDKLPERTSLLEYFIGDSISYISLISKDGFTVKELRTTGLVDKIETFNKSIDERNIPKFKEVSYELYTTVLAPIKDKVMGDALIIVPDGPIWELNFDLLLDSQASSNDPKKLPYLLKEYAISYANSATTLFDYDRPKAMKVNECLAFSFSDSSAVATNGKISLSTFRDIKQDLPGTRKEIKEISKIIDGEYYYGKDAVEANFKAKAENYAILHLALHGEVNHKTPENSRLYFTKDKDSIEDNYLYTHELFTLKLPAELAILSACNTGVGKLTSGEGVMSLGNAFQYAGTKSLLLSRWEVSDEIAPELMKLFYQNLKDGLNKSKALQQAKLTYLDNADGSRANPFYWGSFYLVGDISSIEIGTNNMIFYLISLVLVLLILFILFKKKKILG